MDRRLTNGLAWAGALLVIGIPAADYLTRALDTGATPSVAVVEPQAPATPAPAAQPVAPKVETAAAPAVTTPNPTAPAPAQKSGSAVEDFVQAGRTLPSYITGADKPAAVAATPARPVIETPAETASVRPTIVTPGVAAPQVAPGEQVAALPARVAPVPMPLSMRPAPVTVPLAPSGNAPLIIDQANAPIINPQVMPPQILPPQVVQPGDYVSAEDLADWEAGPLSDFLARRQQQSSATYVVRPNEPVYEPEGAWLDEVLRPGRPSQRFDNDEDVYFVPF